MNNDRCKRLILFSGNLNFVSRKLFFFSPHLQLVRHIHRFKSCTHAYTKAGVHVNVLLVDQNGSIMSPLLISTVTALSDLQCIKKKTTIGRRPLNVRFTPFERFSPTVNVDNKTFSPMGNSGCSIDACFWNV